MEQKAGGRTFTAEQMRWLTLIKEYIANSLTISIKDFDEIPFHDMGGAWKVYELFGSELNGLLEELNQVLVA